MNGYNPMLDYQRNQLMAQQAMIQNQLSQLNQMNPPAQFNPRPQPAQPQFVTRQIGDVKEAAGFMVDPGMMYLFLDTSTGKIYLKYFNSDNGKSEFFTYAVQEDAAPEARTDPMEQINARLSNIEKLIGGIYGKSVPDVAGDAEPDGHDTAKSAGENEGVKPAKVRAGNGGSAGKE